MPFFCAHRGPLSLMSFLQQWFGYLHVTVHVNVVLLKHKLSWPIFTKIWAATSFPLCRNTLRRSVVQDPSWELHIYNQHQLKGNIQICFNSSRQKHFCVPKEQSTLKSKKSQFFQGGSRVLTSRIIKACLKLTEWF